MPSDAELKPTDGLFDESLKAEFVTGRLLEDIRQQIQSGVLKAGDLIKPVRDLMKAYGISYNSVRRALNQLAQEGFLNLEQGRGTFVRGPAVPPRQAGPVEQPARRPKGRPARTTSRGEPKPETAPAEALAPPSVPSQEEEPPLEPGGVANAAPHAAPLPGPSEPESRRLPSPQWGEGKQRQVSSNGSARVPTRRSRGVALVYAGQAQDLLSVEGLGPMLHEIEARVLESGARLTLIASPERGLPDPRELKAAGCDGALLAAADDDVALKQFADGPLPVVLIGCWPAELPVSAVMFDNFSGAHRLTHKLLRAGHRTICFLRSEGALLGAGDAAEREAACRLAVAEAGLEWRESHVFAVPRDGAAASWLADRVLGLKPRPTAVFASEERLAAILCGQLRERNVTVPNQVSVVCFGCGAAPAQQDFTSVRIQPEQLGECAFARLRQLLSGSAAERVRISVPGQWHEGSTVSAPWA
jgi:DNA-binding LacI/PurR family transcriptional regulator